MLKPPPEIPQPLPPPPKVERPIFPTTDFKNFNPSETIMPYLATALGLNVGSGSASLQPVAPDVTDSNDMTYGVPGLKPQQEDVS